MFDFMIILTFVIFAACAVGLTVGMCDEAFRSWLLAPFYLWAGLDKKRRPKP